MTTPAAGAHDPPGPVDGAPRVRCLVWTAQVTPAELAAELAVDPKRVRRWLRDTWPRLTGTSGRWDVTAEQAEAARARFADGDGAVGRTTVEPGASHGGTDQAAPEGGGTSGEQVVWSAWLPLLEAAPDAPREPGVYMARQGRDGPVVYVGMAGERRGQGVRGRLRIYTSGKGLVSGLGEAAFDRALADPEFVRDRLRRLEETGPERGKLWGRAALLRADLWVRWATTTDAAAAGALGLRVIRGLHDVRLWKRRL